MGGTYVKNRKSQKYRDICVSEKNVLKLSCTEFFFPSDPREKKSGRNIFVFFMHHASMRVTNHLPHPVRYSLFQKKKKITTLKHQNNKLPLYTIGVLPPLFFFV